MGRGVCRDAGTDMCTDRSRDTGRDAGTPWGAAMSQHSSHSCPPWGPPSPYSAAEAGVAAFRQHGRRSPGPSTLPSSRSSRSAEPNPPGAAGGEDALIIRLLPCRRQLDGPCINRLHRGFGLADSEGSASGRRGQRSLPSRRGRTQPPLLLTPFPAKVGGELGRGRGTGMLLGWPEWGWGCFIAGRAAGGSGSSGEAGPRAHRDAGRWVLTLLPAVLIIFPVDALQKHGAAEPCPARG